MMWSSILFFRSAIQDLGVPGSVVFALREPLRVDNG